MAHDIQWNGDQLFSAATKETKRERASTATRTIQIRFGENLSVRKN